MSPQKDDDAFWAGYGKSLNPLKRKKSKVKTAPLPPRHSLNLSKKLPHNESVRQKPLEPFRSKEPSMPPTLDRHLERKLKRGDVLLQGRLDLHGLRQEEASQALTQFLDQKIGEGRRMLLIITGKGKGGEGVLRSQLGHWLKASPHAGKVLSLRQAAIKHGGSGAFYLLLRRPKDDIRG